MPYFRSTSVRVVTLLLLAASVARAENPDKHRAEPAAHEQTPPPGAKPTLEIYGFAQTDAIVDFNQNDPNWFDVNRPARLSSFANQFGEDGHFYLSARQSRFGVKGLAPTGSAPFGKTSASMKGAVRLAGAELFPLAVGVPEPESLLPRIDANAKQVEFEYRADRASSLDFRRPI